jgi:hypothetical protein
MYPDSKKRKKGKSTKPDKYYISKRAERLAYQSTYSEKHRDEISRKQRERYREAKNMLEIRT